MKQQTQTNKIEWKEVKMGDLVEIIAGQAPPSAFYNKEKNGLAFLRVNSFGEKYPVNDSWTTESLKSCQKGDILLSVAGTIGAVNIADKDYSITRSIFALRPNTKKINLNYLYYFLKTLKIKLTNSGTGSSQKIITLGTVNNLKFFLPFLPNGTPDLKEQERIVSILEKAETLKQKGKKAEELLDEYLKSVFWEMFYNRGFEEVKLGTVCEFNPKKSEIKGTNENLEVSFVPMSDVQEHNVNLNLKEKRRIKDIFSGYTYFRENDVLLAKVTPCFENGKSGIAKNLNNGVGFGSSEFFVLRPSSKLLAELVYHIISSSEFIEAGAKQMSGTGGLQRLHKNYVTGYDVPLPPLHLQQKFTSIVEHVEKMKEEVNKTQKNSEELFNSLMQKAFRGEL